MASDNKGNPKVPQQASDRFQPDLDYAKAALAAAQAHSDACWALHKYITEGHYHEFEKGTDELMTDGGPASVASSLKGELTQAVEVITEIVKEEAAGKKSEHNEELVESWRDRIREILPKIDANRIEIEKIMVEGMKKTTLPESKDPAAGVPDGKISAAVAKGKVDLGKLVSGYQGHCDKSKAAVLKSEQLFQEVQKAAQAKGNAGKAQAAAVIPPVAAAQPVSAPSSAALLPIPEGKHKAPPAVQPEIDQFKADLAYADAALEVFSAYKACLQQLLTYTRQHPDDDFSDVRCKQLSSYLNDSSLIRDFGDAVSLIRRTKNREEVEEGRRKLRMCEHSVEQGIEAVERFVMGSDGDSKPQAGAPKVTRLGHISGYRELRQAFNQSSEKSYALLRPLAAATEARIEQEKQKAWEEELAKIEAERAAAAAAQSVPAKGAPPAQVIKDEKSNAPPAQLHKFQVILDSANAALQVVQARIDSYEILLASGQNDQTKDLFDTSDLEVIKKALSDAQSQRDLIAGHIADITNGRVTNWAEARLRNTKIKGLVQGNHDVQQDVGAKVKKTPSLVLRQKILQYRERGEQIERLIVSNNQLSEEAERVSRLASTEEARSGSEVHEQSKAVDSKSKPPAAISAGPSQIQPAANHLEAKQSAEKPQKSQLIRSLIECLADAAIAYANLLRVYVPDKKLQDKIKVLEGIREAVKGGKVLAEDGQDVLEKIAGLHSDVRDRWIDVSKKEAATQDAAKSDDITFKSQTTQLRGILRQKINLRKEARKALAICLAQESTATIERQQIVDICWAVTKDIECVQAYIDSWQDSILFVSKNENELRPQVKEDWDNQLQGFRGGIAKIYRLLPTGEIGVPPNLMKSLLQQAEALLKQTQALLTSAEQSIRENTALFSLSKGGRVQAKEKQAWVQRCQEQGYPYIAGVRRAGVQILRAAQQKVEADAAAAAAAKAQQAKPEQVALLRALYDWGNAERQLLKDLGAAKKKGVTDKGELDAISSDYAALEGFFEQLITAAGLTENLTSASAANKMIAAREAIINIRKLRINFVGKHKPATDLVSSFDKVVKAYAQAYQEAQKLGFVLLEAQENLDKGEQKGAARKDSKAADHKHAPRAANGSPAASQQPPGAGDSPDPIEPPEPPPEGAVAVTPPPSLGSGIGAMPLDITGSFPSSGAPSSVPSNGAPAAEFTQNWAAFDRSLEVQAALLDLVAQSIQDTLQAQAQDWLDRHNYKNLKKQLDDLERNAKTKKGQHEQPEGLLITDRGTLTASIRVLEQAATASINEYEAEARKKSEAKAKKELEDKSKAGDQKKPSGRPDAGVQNEWGEIPNAVGVDHFSTFVPRVSSGSVSAHEDSKEWKEGKRYEMQGSPKVGQKGQDINERIIGEIINLATMLSRIERLKKLGFEDNNNIDETHLQLGTELLSIQAAAKNEQTRSEAISRFEYLQIRINSLDEYITKNEAEKVAKGIHDLAKALQEYAEEMRSGQPENASLKPLVDNIKDQWEIIQNVGLDTEWNNSASRMNYIAQVRRAVVVMFKDVEKTYPHEVAHPGARKEELKKIIQNVKEKIKKIKEVDSVLAAVIEGEKEEFGHRIDQFLSSVTVSTPAQDQGKLEHKHAPKAEVDVATMMSQIDLWAASMQAYARVIYDNQPNGAVDPDLRKMTDDVTKYRKNVSRALGIVKDMPSGKAPDPAVLHEARKAVIAMENIVIYYSGYQAYRERARNNQNAEQQALNNVVKQLKAVHAVDEVLQELCPLEMNEEIGQKRHEFLESEAPSIPKASPSSGIGVSSKPPASGLMSDIFMNWAGAMKEYAGHLQSIVNSRKLSLAESRELLAAVDKTDAQWKIILQAKGAVDQQPPLSPSALAAQKQNARKAAVQMYALHNKLYRLAVEKFGEDFMGEPAIQRIYVRLGKAGHEVGLIDPAIAHIYDARDQEELQRRCRLFNAADNNEKFFEFVAAAGFDLEEPDELDISLRKDSDEDDRPLAPDLKPGLVGSPRDDFDDDAIPDEAPDRVTIPSPARVTESTVGINSPISRSDRGFEFLPWLLRAWKRLRDWKSGWKYPLGIVLAIGQFVLAALYAAPFLLGKLFDLPIATVLLRMWTSEGRAEIKERFQKGGGWRALLTAKWWGKRLLWPFILTIAAIFVTFASIGRYFGVPADAWYVVFAQFVGLPVLVGIAVQRMRENTATARLDKDSDNFEYMMVEREQIQEMLERPDITAAYLSNLPLTPQQKEQFKVLLDHVESFMAALIVDKERIVVSSYPEEQQKADLPALQEIQARLKAKLDGVTSSAVESVNDIIFNIRGHHPYKEPIKEDKEAKAGKVVAAQVAGLLHEAKDDHRVPAFEGVDLGDLPGDPVVAAENAVLHAEATPGTKTSALSRVISATKQVHQAILVAKTAGDNLGETVQLLRFLQQARGSVVADGLGFEIGAFFKDRLASLTQQELDAYNRSIHQQAQDSDWAALSKVGVLRTIAADGRHEDNRKAKRLLYRLGERERSSDVVSKRCQIVLESYSDIYLLGKDEQAVLNRIVKKAPIEGDLTRAQGIVSRILPHSIDRTVSSLEKLEGAAREVSESAAEVAASGAHEGGIEAAGEAAKAAVGMATALRSQLPYAVRLQGVDIEHHEAAVEDWDENQILKRGATYEEHCTDEARSIAILYRAYIKALPGKDEREQYDDQYTKLQNIVGTSPTTGRLANLTLTDPPYTLAKKILAWAGLFIAFAIAITVALVMLDVKGVSDVIQQYMYDNWATGAYGSNARALNFYEALLPGLYFGFAAVLFPLVSYCMAVIGKHHFHNRQEAEQMYGRRRRLGEDHEFGLSAAPAETRLADLGPGRPRVRLGWKKELAAWGSDIWHSWTRGLLPFLAITDYFDAQAELREMNGAVLADGDNATDHQKAKAAEAQVKVDIARAKIPVQFVKSILYLFILLTAILMLTFPPLGAASATVVYLYLLTTFFVMPLLRRLYLVVLASVPLELPPLEAIPDEEVEKPEEKPAREQEVEFENLRSPASEVKRDRGASASFVTPPLTPPPEIKLSSSLGGGASESKGVVVSDKSKAQLAVLSDNADFEASAERLMRALHSGLPKPEDLSAIIDATVLVESESAKLADVKIQFKGKERGLIELLGTEIHSGLEQLIDHFGQLQQGEIQPDQQESYIKEGVKKLVAFYQIAIGMYLEIRVTSKPVANQAKHVFIAVMDNVINRLQVLQALKSQAAIDQALDAGAFVDSGSEVSQLEESKESGAPNISLQASEEGLIQALQAVPHGSNVDWEQLVSAAVDQVRKLKDFSYLFVPVEPEGQPNDEAAIWAEGIKAGIAEYLVEAMELFDSAEQLPDDTGKVAKKEEARERIRAMYAQLPVIKEEVTEKLKGDWPVKVEGFFIQVIEYVKKALPVLEVGEVQAQVAEEGEDALEAALVGGGGGEPQPQPEEAKGVRDDKLGFMIVFKQKPRRPYDPNKFIEQAVDAAIQKEAKRPEHKKALVLKLKLKNGKDFDVRENIIAGMKEYLNELIRIFGSLHTSGLSEQEERDLNDKARKKLSEMYGGIEVVRKDITDELGAEIADAVARIYEQTMKGVRNIVLLHNCVPGGNVATAGALVRGFDRLMASINATNESSKQQLLQGLEHLVTAIDEASMGLKKVQEEMGRWNRSDEAGWKKICDLAGQVSTKVGTALSRASSVFHAQQAVSPLNPFYERLKFFQKQIEIQGRLLTKPTMRNLLAHSFVASQPPQPPSVPQALLAPQPVPAAPSPPPLPDSPPPNGGVDASSSLLDAGDSPPASPSGGESESEQEELGGGEPKSGESESPKV